MTRVSRILQDVDEALRVTTAREERAKLSRKVTAQVALESVINHREDYEPETVALVREEATAAGVSTFYLDMVE